MQSTLACLCLALCISSSFAAPLSAFKSIREEALGSPPFCRGTPCPDYEVVKKTSNYELRKFEPTTWATVQAPGSYAKASTEGYAELYRYVDGANEEGQKLEGTKPLTLIFKAEDDYSKCEQNHTVAYYLVGKDEESAPKPTDANVKIFSTGEKSAYVKSFSGFATESSILSAAKDLSEELSKDGIETSTTFFFALYDGPQILINRHNEVWLAEA
ncbi:hypothetical protein WJX74_002394 [Apatococcus lobatus]|uniref:Heme-binding protein 2 n=1 Tax=Apatococcus lobatus TaxID=904363 RepID=A0AAW1RP28_9CHLO